MQYDQNVNQLEKLKATEGTSCSVMHFVSVLAEVGLELFLSFLLGYSDLLAMGQDNNYSKNKNLQKFLIPELICCGDG